MMGISPTILLEPSTCRLGGPDGRVGVRVATVLVAGSVDTVVASEIVVVAGLPSAVSIIGTQVI